MSDLARPVPLDRIGPAGLDHGLDATPDELAGLARRLHIPAVLSLRCRFHLTRLPGNVVAVTGDLHARVVQTCVLSLDDFDQDVAEPFAVQFVPAGTEAPDDDLEAPDQIPYAGATIDLGEAAAQQLALALDPYPRKPGVEFDAPSDGPPHPFARLRHDH